jgi:hypothetical protein
MTLTMQQRVVALVNGRDTAGEPWRGPCGHPGVDMTVQEDGRVICGAVIDHANHLRCCAALDPVQVIRQYDPDGHVIPRPRWTHDPHLELVLQVLHAD